MSELRIENARIVTMDDAGSIIDGGLVCIEDSRITYAGPARAPGALPAGQARRLDARGGLVLPGLINCHTHAAMTLMRGLADDLPLNTWLMEHIFPAEKNLTGESVYWGTMLACLEMITSGTTSFCDMYLFAPEVIRAARDSGLRAVVGEVLYDFPSPSYGELTGGLELTRRLIAENADHPRVSGAVMPHALYTCSENLMQAAGEICRDTGASMNIHLSETEDENRQVVEKWGARPLAVMERLGLLNERLWIDHAVHLTAEEMAALAKSGARVSHCPESNLKLASGVFPLKAMLEAGVKVGLGTDGTASNNDLDMFGEMDICSKLAKVSTGDPTAAPAGVTLGLATRMAAEVFAPGERLGVIEAGALADLIVVDTNRPHLTPMYNPLSHLVYAARGSDVIHTVCHGRVLMADGVVEVMDAAEVMAKAREHAMKLTGRAL